MIFHKVNEKDKILALVLRNLRDSFTKNSLRISRTGENIAEMSSIVLWASVSQKALNMYL